MTAWNPTHRNKRDEWGTQHPGLRSILGGAVL